jgi:RAB protein geranylgeranyltransferase component A
MKKSILMLSIALCSTGAFANETIKSISRINAVECTRTVTVSESAQVICPEGTIITITATSTQTATAATCDEAQQEGYIAAHVVASATVENNVQAKNYICP